MNGLELQKLILITIFICLFQITKTICVYGQLNKTILCIYYCILIRQY